MLQPPSKFEVRIGDTLSDLALISVVTLTCNLLTSNLVSVIALGWATSLPILVFMGLFVLNIFADKYQSDGRRDLVTLTFNL